MRVKVRNRLPAAAMSKPAADVSTYRCTDVTYEAVGSNDGGDSSYSGSVVNYELGFAGVGTSTKTSSAAHPPVRPCRPGRQRGQRAPSSLQVTGQPRRRRLP